MTQRGFHAALLILLLGLLPAGCAPRTPLPTPQLQVRPLNPYVVIRSVPRSRAPNDLDPATPQPLDAPRTHRTRHHGWQISSSGMTTWSGQPIMPLPFAQLTAPDGKSFKLYLLIDRGLGMISQSIIEPRGDPIPNVLMSANMFGRDFNQTTGYDRMNPRIVLRLPDRTDDLHLFIAYDNYGNLMSPDVLPHPADLTPPPSVRPP